ncbi:unnamed protein product [Closterium sp. NIES-53]
MEAWGPIDLVVAGWECQGYSRAGDGRGMEDPRGASFWDLTRVLRLIRKREREVVFILENFDMADDRRELVRRAYEEITEELGRGVLIDAAQLGSRAHRPRRAEWSIGGVPAARLGTDAEASPKTGEPRRAWPTLVSFANARGFVMEGVWPGPGMVYDSRTRRWEEPSANERELAMGHQWGATSHPEVSEAQRRAALGRAMDLNVMTWILETIRMHLKTKKVQGELEGSEYYREGREAAWRRQQLTRIEARREERIREGWAFMAVAARDETVTGGGEAPAGAGEGSKENVTKWEIGSGLGAQAAVDLRNVLEQHKGTFAFTLKELGRADTAVREQYAAATVVAARTDITGDMSAKQMCGDYRGLNKVTVPDRYPMQSAEEIFNKLQGAVVFSKLDLRQGFNQIPIKAEDCKKTAFHSSDRLYEWRVMPLS